MASTFDKDDNPMLQVRNSTNHAHSNKLSATIDEQCTIQGENIKTSMYSAERGVVLQNKPVKLVKNK